MEEREPVYKFGVVENAIDRTGFDVKPRNIYSKGRDAAPQRQICLDYKVIDGSSMISGPFMEAGGII